ncbi:Cullin-domain-containing protein [Lindgomyces ingoldianus]|uniref:Cullin-domain-containing protein n=1 Tax=Lindgomyces ingoldianus TaxID=673940 RepID=A0ACB6QIX3_9PLEO|nr:Cullin-domain-containing protein [Lindgomyces ingoldianus]KAF2466085.1 Cullin-domain-containing protein [Lindgomyces ingoldianus]
MSANPADRKRKHSSHTIHELFTAQHKPNTSAAPLSPSSKRGKFDNTSGSKDKETATGAGIVEASLAMSAADMYHFPSSKRVDAGGRGGKEVVEINSSPENSPSKRPSMPKNGIRKATPNMHAHGSGPKRMLVKNFKPARKVDPKDFFDQVWGKVDKALDIVFSREEIAFSLEELYRGVENLCRQGMAGEVCERLVQKCEGYVGGALKKKVKEIVGRKNVDILRGALQAWATWGEQLKYLHWIFCYMDRAYLLPKQQSLHEIAVDLFRKLIFEQPKLNSKIVDGACDLIAVDRAGEHMDRQMFSDAIKMFHEMQVYTTYLEPRMLKLSQDYVVDWADRISTENGLADYVKAAKALMKAEMERVEVFGLDSSTRRDLLTLLEDRLISSKESRLINQDDLAGLLEDNAVNDLGALYSLLERRRLGANIRLAFMKWIEDTGTAIVFDEKEQDNMVVKLLCLKRQLDTIWKLSFHRNAELGHGLREAFETFMNKTKKTSTTWNTDNSKPGEMIAKYVDVLLRGGAKAIPAQLSRTEKQLAVAEEEDNEDVVFDEDTEVNNQLDQVLDLFRFVHGKAVFEAFYKKDLARRLLMGRSASADAERSMLARLKTECGAGFTANLEQMFKDIELGREEMTSYKMILEERNQKLPLDLNVNILSAAAWPTYPDVPVIIPTQIKSAIDKFETHYKSKHSGRKLDWKHALAHCQIKAKFPRGNKELVVSSFQAIVLLLFNGLAEDEHVDYNTLKEATGLPPAELSRTLQSLACAKLRPLTKHPKSRDISPTDTFTLNASFSDPKYRIKINTVQLKETLAENKETHERVAADRNYETQAAIVRILKARKKINHSELVAETIRVTRSRGTLDVGGIKRNIDRLIEKEFLEREEDGGYSYVA